MLKLLRIPNHMIAGGLSLITVFLYSQAVIFPLEPCVSLEKEHFVKLLTFTEQIDKYMLLRWKWPEKKTMKTMLQ